MKFRTSRRNDIKKYLKRREEDLILLQKDLRCRPFVTDANAPELVVAVDWSEVYSYIFGEPPPSTDPLVKLIKTETSHAAHQIGLMTLLERFPGEIVLIPPYVREMSGFVEFVRSQAQGAALPEMDYKDAYSRLMAGMANSDSLHDLTDLAAKLRRGNTTMTFDSFKTDLDNIDKHRIQGWIEERFSTFLLLAKISQLNVLGSLSFLLRGSQGAGPRIRLLADKYRDLAMTFIAEPPIGNRWRNELNSATSLRKAKASLEQDALAVLYLERLNTLLHSQNKQLLFVTRSTDIYRVLSDHPGRFGCLSKHYYSADAATESAAGPPNIVRTWRIFFELGLVLPFKDNVSKPVDYSELPVLVHRQLLDVQSRLTVLTDTESDAVYKRVARDFEESVQNRKALISTERPRLAQFDASKLRDTDVAVAFFVRYVTDPDSFLVERENIRKGLLQEVADVQGEVTFLDASISDPWEYRNCRSITASFVKKVAVGNLVEDVKDQKLKKLLETVFQFIRDRHISDVIKTAIYKAQSIHVNVSSDDTDQNHYAILKAVLAFATGHVDGLQFFLNEYHPIFSSLRELSPQKTLFALLSADVSALKRDEFAANTILRRAWLRSRQLIVTGYGGDQSPQVLRCYTGLIDGWLRFHLEWIEIWEERLDSFPLSSEDNRFEIEDILEAAVRIRLHPNFAHIEDSLSLSLANNLVYGATRVTPSVAFNGVGSTALVGDQHVRDLLTKNLWSSTVIAAVRELEELQVRSPEVYDTLGYYYTKYAYWAKLAERNPVLLSGTQDIFLPLDLTVDGALDRAARYLLEASFGVDRTQRLVRVHQKLHARVSNLIQRRAK